MIVLNMGIPRSGTVWTFNVLRNIFEARNIEYDTYNKNLPAEVNACLLSLDTEKNAIAHFHDVSDAVRNFTEIKGAVSFINYCDPRDVIVSLMRLHLVTFDTAVLMTLAAFASFKAAIAIPRVMFIPYPHITDYPKAIIFQIAVHCGQLFDFGTIKVIAEKTAMAHHKDAMQEVNRSDDSAEDVGPDYSSVRSIPYYTKSLITDRHIPSEKTGRWKEELSEDEQQKVNKVFRPVISTLEFDIVQ